MPEATVADTGGGEGPILRIHFVQQVLQLAGPYWKSEHKGKIRAATLALFLLTVGQVALAVWSTYWNRDLFDALEQRFVPGVLAQVGVFALIFALSIGVTAAHLMVKRWLQIGWRAWLTEKLIGRWMEDGRHCRLLFSAGEHDNPDGRIAEDIRIATETAIALVHTMVYSLLSLGLFIDILWSVSGSITVPGTTIQVPGYLVPLAFLYAGAGTVLGWMFGRPLVRSTNTMQSAEANFRFGLARAREHSEAIALIHGEPIERAGAAVRFTQIVRNWDRQSLAYMGIVSFSTGYGLVLPVFPILVAAPQYIFGTMSLGALMQAALAFQRLTSALSWPIDNLADLARCRASADRVLSLHRELRRLDAEEHAPNGHRIGLGRSDRGRLVIDDLCIVDPRGRVLIEHFSAEIQRGERVLVAGDPTVTSSLFKVIAGLWPWGSGRVLLPESNSTLFMPDRPYLPEGTLRQALCYPSPPDAFSDECVRHALECAGISWLAPRLDEPDIWERALPLRAQQRLGFARVLMQRPTWIFMEEATSAFDPKGERLILQALHRGLANAAVLTIGFHPGLEPLYQRKIILSRVQDTTDLIEGQHENSVASH
jgi:putative ATP-binding cassette transporter